jgi:hypothetical protein
VVPGGSWKQNESFSFPGDFKTYAYLWEGKNQVINEWGGTWVVPGLGEGAFSCPQARM